MISFANCTPEQAARKTHEYITTELASIAGKTALLLTPERSEELGYGKVWRVMWEEGPFEWALALCGGVSLFDFEAGNYSGTGPSEIDLDSFDGLVEPYHSFDLGFYDE